MGDPKPSTTREVIERAMLVLGCDPAHMDNPLSMKSLDELQALLDGGLDAEINQRHADGFVFGYRKGFKEGAEQMRERCAETSDEITEDAGVLLHELRRGKISKAIRDLPLRGKEES